VANGQYGGQTFSVSHLAPFVRISYEKWKDKVREECNLVNSNLSEHDIEEIAWMRTRDEVKSGVQTIQFQENTFSSSNGQTPFVSIFMWINEEPEYITETAMIIEEMINLRYEGMENEYGVKVTPAFPKLLYVLDENNVPQDSEYRYLTDLAVNSHYIPSTH
jgi:ribonucleoside-triphosphate reductase